MTLIDNIATVLTGGGYSNLRAYQWDSSTSDQILIIPAGGRAEGVLGAAPIEKPNVQIQVRHATLATAESRALAIKDLLHRSTSVSDTVIVEWDGRWPDHWIDESGKHVFAIEFKVILL